MAERAGHKVCPRVARIIRQAMQIPRSSDGITTAIRAAAKVCRQIAKQDAQTHRLHGPRLSCLKTSV